MRFMGRSVLLALTALTRNVAAYAATCESLSSITTTSECKLSVTSATMVAANLTTGMPAYCSVAALVEGRFGFWAMFPATDSWNSRTVMLGCGGSCGGNSLLYATYQAYVAQGYSAATTNMHYNDGSTSLQWNWAKNNRTNEIDFSYLSTHLSAVIQKEMVGILYGKPAEHRYFYGGSTGGRQGLVSAQRYPTDFDGIVGIAPAANETGIGMYHVLWSAMATLDAKAKPILTYNDTIVLNDAAIAKCDALDGLKDGIINNMNACNFDPRSIICSGHSTKNCISKEAAAAALKVYQGARNSKGVQLFPSGPNPGSELNWQSNYIPAPGSNTSVYYEFGRSFALNIAYETDPDNTTWWPEYFDWDTPASTFALMENFLSGCRLDMTAFRNLGGKYILYQGLSDQSVIPLHTRQVYARIRDIHGGEDETNKWMRYYEVPGVNHVSGGVGADTIAALAYLDNWVTKGTAPDYLVGQHVLTNGTVAFERPHYKFPYYAHYKGGNTSSIDSFMPVRMANELKGLDIRAY